MERAAAAAKHGDGKGTSGSGAQAAAAGLATDPGVKRKPGIFVKECKLRTGPCTTRTQGAFCRPLHGQKCTIRAVSSSGTLTLLQASFRFVSMLLARQCGLTPLRLCMCSGCCAVKSMMYGFGDDPEVGFCPSLSALTMNAPYSPRKACT